MSRMPLVEKYIASGQHQREDVNVIFYDLNGLENSLNAIKNSFPEDSIHAVAIKTCSLEGVLKHIGNLGHAHEAASAGEVEKALSASKGFVVYDGPAKHHFELEKMHPFKERMLINANSFHDLHKILQHPFQNLGIRINTEVAPGVEKRYDVSTGRSKFGVPLSRREEIVQAYLDQPRLNALHFHIGSGMTSIAPFKEAFQRIKSLLDDIHRKREDAGIQNRIVFLDIGGGLKAELEADQFDLVRALGQLVKEQFSYENAPRIVTEFGQYVHTHHAFLLTEISDILQHDTHNATMILSAGANIFLRQAYTDSPSPFRYELYEGSLSGNELNYDLAGPLCFSGDYIERSVRLPEVKIGDHLIIDRIGANTFSLYSEHCSLPFPKVVYV